MNWVSGYHHNNVAQETSGPISFEAAQRWLVEAVDDQIMQAQATAADPLQLMELGAVHRHLRELPAGLGDVAEAGPYVFWLAPLIDPGSHDASQLAELITRYADAIATGLLR